MSGQVKSAAVRYREHLANRTPVIIDVTAPSGFVFKRIKPSTFAVIFDMGELPQKAASEAAEAWREQGVQIGVEETPVAEDAAEANRKLLEIRERILTNSVEPKLVNRPPENVNEMSVEELDPEDLAYLFKFEASRGDTAAMLHVFPEEPGQRPLAGSNVATFRKATKRISKDKRRRSGT